MSVKITYFVHGTTTDNEQELATGHLPGELSEKGRQQAIELSSQVKDKRFDAVFCSDLKRSIESAELGFGDKYEIIVDKRIRECDYGDFAGGPAAAFKGQMIDYLDTPFPNGGSYRDVESAMASWLEDLKHDYDGKHVAVVAHQAPQLALDVLLKGQTWQEAIDNDWRKTKAWQPGWEYTAN